MPQETGPISDQAAQDSQGGPLRGADVLIPRVEPDLDDINACGPPSPFRSPSPDGVRKTQIDPSDPPRPPRPELPQVRLMTGSNLPQPIDLETYMQVRGMSPAQAALHGRRRQRFSPRRSRG